MTGLMARRPEISRIAHAGLAARIMRLRLRLSVPGLLIILSCITFATCNMTAETTPTAESFASKADAAFKANKLDLAEMPRL